MYYILIFHQLQVVKISCKLLIISLNYERNIRAYLSIKHHVYNKVHCVSKKTSLTFLAVTWKPIIRFW